MTSVSRRGFLAAGSALLASPMLGHAAAADWPSKPVRIVVAFAPGGSLDALGRRIGAHFEKVFGVPFIIENRAGAGGRIGTQYVGKAPGDGYTLIATSSAAHGAAPGLYPDLGYHPMDDFTHIGLICSGPMALMVKGDAPYNNAAELVATLKDETLFFGSGGIGSLGHLTGTLIGRTLNVQTEHVSYKGSAPAQLDLLAGNLMAVCDNMSSHTAQYRAGALKVIGITASERYDRLPDIPTFAEQGYPQLEASAWYGLSGSPGIPPAIAEKLNAALAEFLADPDTAEILAEMTMRPEGRMSPQTYTDFVASEVGRWADLVRTEGISVS